MSIRALEWAWQAQVSPTCKLVLLAIADRANADGECFPSVRDIMARTCLKERAVRYSLQELTDNGWLRRDMRSGRSTNYVVSLDRQTPAPDAPLHDVHPCTTCTTPLHDVHPPPAPRAPVTLIEPIDNQVPPSEVYAPTLALTSDTLTPAAKTKERAGTRLPDGWLPTPEGLGLAETLGLNSRAVLSTFRDYWIAQPGAKGRKADWDATWRNWCRRDAERSPMKRPAKTSQWSVEDQNEELLRLIRAPDHETETTLLRLAR